MESFPEDVLKLIMAFLQWQDLICLFRVNKRFHNISKNKFWERRTELEFGPSPIRSYENSLCNYLCNKFQILAQEMIAEARRLKKMGSSLYDSDLRVYKDLIGRTNLISDRIVNYLKLTQSGKHKIRVFYIDRALPGTEALDLLNNEEIGIWIRSPKKDLRVALFFKDADGSGQFISGGVIVHSREGLHVKTPDVFYKFRMRTGLTETAAAKLYNLDTILPAVIPYLRKCYGPPTKIGFSTPAWL